ncbi:hypothetical protein [Microvirga rosea]|uniref:hypothetical protein n=1 Tax=Microvirga rosea TaxID=2715425 RepID=UPI001D0B352E|nr:hypothetical protein [Microvirga rosea]MCB8821470.1 hypothetical protein [Microvirga rosea]
MGFDEADEQPNKLGDAGVEASGLKGATGDEAGDRIRGMVLGCLECMEGGQCRRGLDQEQLPPNCMGQGVWLDS